MKNLKLIYMITAFVLINFSGAYAQQVPIEKLKKATEVLNAFSTLEEGIPTLLMQQAKGIIVVPGMIKAGFGIGGQRGKGIAMMKRKDGSWSDPVFVTLTGGSIGFQAGVQSIDLVMVFTENYALLNLGNGEFTLGGDVGVAAGPVGRTASANTDSKFESEIYSYSRTKGLFAGITLNGTKLSVDASANRTFYDDDIRPVAVFQGEDESKHSEVASLKETIAALEEGK